jgi:hypothetical protein
MSLFSNDAVNRVHVHSAIQSLAQNGGGVFVFVFLLKAGVPAPLVFVILAAMVACRFALRPFVLPLAQRIGVRQVLIAGTVLEAAIFPILPFVHGPGPLLFAVIGVGAVGSVLYWTSFHAYYAALGDAEHRGGQVAVREAGSALVAIIAPAIAGWALVTAGPQAAFWGAGLVQILAAVPLIGAPNVAAAHEAPGGFRAARLGAVLMATDGFFSASYYYLWQIGLFLTLGESFGGYGGAMALAGVLGAAGTLGLGRLIDLGHGVRTVYIAYGIAAAVLALRAASLGHPALAVAANAGGAMAASLLMPVLMARVYNLSKSSPCPLRFSIATEGGWDLGCGTGCLLAAALTWAHASLAVPMLLGLVAAVAAVAILTRSYRWLGEAEPEPA